MKYSAVIVAAGSGSRMNLGFNKVYARLKDGRTILEHSMSLFLADPDCLQVVVVTEAGTYRKQIPGRLTGKITFAHGGDTRQQSVYNGLLCAIGETVFIHDGARPFLDQESLEKLKEAMETADGALLTVPCKDTIKTVQDGVVMHTVERSVARAAQTPQAFRTDDILYCMEMAEKTGYTGTDDCSLAERFLNIAIIAVDGKYENYKITTPEDLR